ncbi:Palmitoyltransferase swf1 [Aspergillus crustosus]
MGFLRTIALAILGFSTFVFIVLFGRLPVFRKTPIGLFHRAIWIHFPNGVAYLDSCLFGGRFLGFWRRAGSYIFFENHPLVLIFFTSLLFIGEAIFVPSAWPRVSLIHHFCIPVAVGLPYYYLYASVVTKSFITPENHAEEMKRYPYDKVIFHPGHRCSTCDFLKPARSKHCSHCEGCIARHDHHCVWLTNCVGLNNYRYFLSLLLSLSVMLVYGSCLGYSLITKSFDALIPPTSPVRMRKQSWTTFLNMWAAVVASDPRVGGVTMLMCMTAPLAFAFFVYHTYLIWAGMTTNESAKWSDWKDDVADGIAFRLFDAEDMSKSPLIRSPGLTSSWPGSSAQMLVLTEGEPPREGFRLYERSNDIIQPSNADAPIDRKFVRVRSMKEIDNIYDLGFWNNVRHVFETCAEKGTHND